MAAEDQWFHYVPTHAALVAVLHTWWSEDLVDQPFLDKYCVGFTTRNTPASAPKQRLQVLHPRFQWSIGVEKHRERSFQDHGIPCYYQCFGRGMGRTVKPCAIQLRLGLTTHCATVNWSVSCNRDAVNDKPSQRVYRAVQYAARESDINIPFVLLPDGAKPSWNINFNVHVDRRDSPTNVTTIYVISLDGKVRGAERLC